MEEGKEELGEEGRNDKMRGSQRRERAGRK